MSKLFAVIIGIVSLTLQGTHSSVIINEEQGQARNFNMNMLNNVLNKPVVQNTINNAINNGQLQNVVNTINNLVKPSKQVPNVNNQNSVMPPSSAAEEEIIFKWIEMNIMFILNNTNALGPFEKGLIADVLPQLIRSASLDEILQQVEPFFIAIVASVLEDQSLFFSENPLRDTVKSLLRKYFESPEAPQFLKDLNTQNGILNYVDQLLVTNDFNMIFNKASMDLIMYLNQGASQEIKMIIQQVLPDLYELIKNENDIVAIYEYTYSYLVTFVLQYYNMFMGLFNMGMNPNASGLTNALQILQKMKAFSNKA